MASRSLGSLTLDLVLRMGGFQSGMDKAARETEKSAKRIQNSAKSLQRGLTTLFAGFSVASLIQAVVRNTSEAEDALRQLEARIKSTGNVAGVSIPDLQSFASELQGLTTYGDDAILAMQGVLLTFTNIRGATVKDATRSILDLSTAMGQDLQSSAVQVGKALNDPVKGITALTRVGVAFTEQQKNLIESLVESGDVAGAQAIILKELQTEFGGAAEAAGNTFGGALKQVQNAFGDLLEAKGGVGDATGALKDFAALLRDPETVAAAEALTGAIIRMFKGVSEAITGTVNVTRFLGEEISARLGGPALDDVVRMEQELERLQELRNTSILTDGKALDRLRFFGKDGLVEWYSDEDLDREINKLKDALATAYKEFPTPFQVAPTSSSGGDVSTTPAATSEAYDKLSAQLREQIALFGDNSEYAKLAYQIQTGAIEDLTEAEGRRLLGLARTLDAMKETAEFAKEEAQQWQEFTKQIETNAQQALQEIELPALDELQAEADAFFAVLERGAAITESLRTPQEEYNEALRELDELLAAGVISEETHTRGAKRALEELNKEVNTFYDEAKRNAQDILGQGIYDSLKDGFDKGAGEALNSFSDMLLRMATEAIAADIMSSIFKTNSDGGGGILDAIGSIFGRASGGPVTANQPYLVGERGPEVIVPRTAGTVVPNDKLGGGVTFNNRITISAPTEQAGRAAANQTAAALAKQLATANRRNN